MTQEIEDPIAGANQAARRMIGQLARAEKKRDKKLTENQLLDYILHALQSVEDKEAIVRLYVLDVIRAMPVDEEVAP